MSSQATQLERQAQAAAEALARGQAAIEQGDHATARDWLERAHRLAPGDPSVALILASLYLHSDPPRALPLLEIAARRADASQIWLGLAALRQGAPRLDALVHLLRHFVLTTDLAQLGTLAQDRPWAGVISTSEDGLIWQGSEPGCTAWLDGQPWHSPALPMHGQVFEIRLGKTQALGSPFRLERFRRPQGCVALDHGTLSGWAWLPAHPEEAVRLVISGSEGGAHHLTAEDLLPHPPPLTRPRRFQVALAQLRPLGRVLHVRDAAGFDLPGSPLDLDAAHRRPPARATSVKVRPNPARPVAIVVPAYRNRALTMACLTSVFRSAPDAWVIVVDDASPEPDLAHALDLLAAQGRIRLIRHERNQGFPTAANTGLRAALALLPRHDIVLLNADAELPVRPGPSWLDRLRGIVHATTDIGTATPLSNDASLLSYPDRDRSNARPSPRALAQLDRIAAKANADAAIDIPTGVGFCLYIRAECALETGLLREDLFAQGYGEENDFCLRATQRGWRHVAAPGVFVAHDGAASFGAARAALMARNLRLLEHTYPGYTDHIRHWAQALPAQDRLASARRGIDAERWRAQARPHAVLFITHAGEGGVARVVADRARAIQAQGGRAILLRPVRDPSATAGTCLEGLCQLIDAAEPEAFPNLIFDLRHELEALTTLLRRDRLTHAELHHRLGHPPSVLDLPQLLGISLDIHAHDAGAYCPRLTLLGEGDRYCGEPASLAACEACIARLGDRSDEGISPAALRARSARDFARARRVVVPSEELARRLRRHFPTLQPEIEAPEDDTTLPRPRSPRPHGPRTIAVIGGIGPDKGIDILRLCAEDAALRNLPLRFRLVGHSSDDAALLATGRVFITGAYAEDEALELIRAQHADLAFLPSVVPESWGFTLGLAWRAGLPALVFDLGQMAARIRRQGPGFGRILPLGLPPGMINDQLLHAAIP